MTFAPVLRRIRLAFAVVAVTMMVFGLASYFTIDRLIQIAQSAVGAEERLVTLEQLDARTSRTQAGLREYVMSGAATDLDAFQAQAAEQRDTLEALGELPLLPEHAQLERLLSERTRFQYEVAAARERSGVSAALALLASDAAERTDTELADLLRTAKAREDYAWRRARGTKPAVRAQYLVMAEVAVLVAMLAWAFWIVMRYERERRRVTDLLNESEAMSRALVANIADGLVTLSEDLVILSMNGSVLQMLGYREEEVIGRRAAELMVPGDREPHHALMRSLLEKPQAFRLTGLETTALRKDGGTLPVQVSLSDVTVGGRRVVTALLRDMTSIRQATEAAQASEQNLRQITDTLPVIIAEFDMNLRFRFLNRAAGEFLGLAPDAAVGRSLVDVLPAELFELHRPHLKQALRGSTERYEVTATAADGTRGSYDMHVIPRMAAGSGRLVGIYVFATDITLLKRIDAMKTEFISTVSHELRTPLTSIRGSLGLMSGGIAGKLSETAVHLVGIAQSNCDRLIRLINDILDIEKIESGTLPLRLKSVQLTPLVRQAIAANEGFAREHGVTLRMHASEEVFTVRADVDRLQQVLANLLSNAVKFSPPEGVVDVRVCGMRDGVRVEVADRGPGIPMEFQRRIFQKFSQADASDTRRKGGTGLGLNISRTLVEKMGGQIGFSSTPGKGATFFFELPRRDAFGPPTVPGMLLPDHTGVEQ